MKTSIRKISLLMAASMLLLYSCKNDREENTSTPEQAQQGLPEVSDEMMESAVIYEANIRQYSAKGDFASFTQDIPQLKELGVKIIWLMPIHPISMVKRKATPDLSIEDIEDASEKEKYLGSYYAIADYRGINPEFGDQEDFRELVETAHENGMYVILDWVANHTGWDHHWLEEHPQYYTTNEEGEIIDPIDPGTGESWGWTDVADLNYDNKDLWEAMIGEMEYWVEEFDIDGFRADVAGEVPTPFWEEAVDALQKHKPVFMLAESEKKSLFHKAFDMGYNWEGHHLMNQLAKGEITVEAWDAYMEKIDTTYQEDDFLMNFVTNHDENSWAGTVRDRMGEASQTFVAMTYTLPGMPLIYSGLEYDLDHQLKFFEKDSIPKTRGEMWPLLVQLGQLKNQSKALHGGKEAASYKRLKTTNDAKILAFEREKGGERLIFVANMTDHQTPFSLELEGSFEDYMAGLQVKLSPEASLELDAWEYKILINN